MQIKQFSPATQFFFCFLFPLPHPSKPPPAREGTSQQNAEPVDQKRGTRDFSISRVGFILPFAIEFYTYIFLNR